jgi:RNA polymerase sigma factor (sigma-70 family)
VQTAVAGLYVDHHAWLVAWLTGRLRNAAEAADLAQDTFLRVLGREGETVGGLREPRAWLTTIAKGLLLDHWRRREIERAYLDTLATLPEAVAPSAEDRYIVLETLVRLEALLDGLKPAWRSALLWARLEGLTLPEIAVRLEVSVATAERYLAKALRHCYDRLYLAA